jgi:hypothetical protein
MKKHCTRYRPTRSDLGGGKFDEVLGDGVDLWGVMTFQDNETRLVVDAREDVQVGDIVTVEE